MRTRRFRPSVNFRPGIDLLMPRIAPSDIAVMIYVNGDPPAPDTGTLPLCPIWTGPSEDPTPADISAAPSYSYNMPVLAD